jgi:hypothetical protein
MYTRADNQLNFCLSEYLTVLLIWQLLITPINLKGIHKLKRLFIFLSTKVFQGTNGHSKVALPFLRKIINAMYFVLSNFAGENNGV